MIYEVARQTAVITSMVFIILFGASVFAMYPVIVAHANDHAAPGSFIQVSGGLLLVFGVGSIIGPTVAGLAMGVMDAAALFAVTGACHLSIILFTLYRLRIRAAVAQDAKTPFHASPMARMSTPETVALAADQRLPSQTVCSIGPKPSCASPL